MTEYELADAFLDQTGSLLTYFMAFVSATSALLIVSYFTGANLPVRLSRVVIGIYASTSVFLIVSVQRQSSLILVLREKMQTGLSWHTAVTEPQWVLPSMLWLGFITMVAIFISAIWYFYIARNNETANT